MALLCMSPFHVVCAIESSVQVFSKVISKKFVYDHTYKTENVNTTNTVDFITFSPKYKYFAALFSDKTLVVWNIVDDKIPWNKLEEVELSRRSTSAAFDPNEENIYVADKSGDLYKFNLSGLKDQSKDDLSPVLGHVSILLHVSVTNKYIITIDRDEKIRISLRDQPYEIQCFCLGHTDFVCNALVHDEEHLVSSSGDGTIRSWNIVTGLQTSVYVTNEMLLSNDKSMLNSENHWKKQSVPALLTHAKSLGLYAVGNVGINNNVISIFQIDDSSPICLKSCYKINLNADTKVVYICFDPSNQDSSAILYVLTQSENILRIKTFSCTNDSFNNFDLNKLDYINTTLTNFKVENACRVNFLQLFKTTVPGYVYEAFSNKKENQFKNNSSKKAKLQ